MRHRLQSRHRRRRGRLVTIALGSGQDLLHSVLRIAVSGILLPVCPDNPRAVGLAHHQDYSSVVYRN
jgi:hypothetical protein